MKILVTGGAGFIGSSFVRHVLAAENDVEVLNYDLLTYAGNLKNVQPVAADPRYRFVRGDVAESSAVDRIFAEFGPDAVVNFAAETHVDRSILDSPAFVRTNVEGTRCLLDAARRHGTPRFVQISTDEVYGSLGPEGAFREDSPIDPSSPYSASKAAADFLALAYHRTHGLGVSVTRCSNNYGPFQFPEKLIPVLIMNATHDRDLPIYGDGLNVREWIHADDHSRAVMAVVRKGTPGRVYNVGSGHEKTNLEVVREILRLVGKPESLIQFVTDRPGHDRRYAIDCSRIREELGWSPEVDFTDGLTETVAWYRERTDWVDEIRDATYLSYYDRMYTHRDRTLQEK